MSETRGPVLPQGGFTLIEVIVYLALFSILMAGAVMSLYALGSCVGEERDAATVTSEADFVDAKFAWLVSQNGSLAGIVFDPVNQDITLNSVPLTSANVVVSALTVTPVKNASGATIAYDASFVMNGELFSRRYYVL